MKKSSFPAHFKILISLGLLVCCLAGTSVAEIVCDHCRKAITEGQWIEASGRYFHTFHFTCAQCGEDLRYSPYYEENGLFYDSTCYVRLFVPICDLCGEPLIGQFIENDAGSYHISCYEDHVALRCGICKGIIDGQYYKDSRGNIFHAEHEGELPECEYCGCLISPELTGDGKTYKDNRNVCGLCLKTVVGNMNEARRILADVKAKLAGFGIDTEEKKIPLKLVDRNEMLRLSKGVHHDPMGYTTYKEQSFLGGAISKRDFEVYLLDGLPRTEFVFAAAHELMHVWLFKNAPLEMTAILCEGSCDYAAAKALLASGEPEAARVWRSAMDNPDPVYGDGLRRVDAYVNEVGVSNWLRYLKEHTEPPW